MEITLNIRRTAIPQQFTLALPAANSARCGGYLCPESFSFPKALQMGKEILGEQPRVRLVGDPAAPWILSTGYLRSMGASGLIFGLPFEPLEFHLESVALAFFDAGYGYAWHKAGEDFRERVCTGLLCGSPVILLRKDGLRGALLVTGYEAGGTVLIGRVSVPSSRAGECGTEDLIQRGWETRWAGAIIFGQKSAVPDLKSIYIRVFLSTTETLASGKHAYASWVKAMEVDPHAWLCETSQNTGGIRALLGEVAEARWYGAHYLNDAAANLPDARAYLFAASVSCEREHEIMWEIEGLVRKGVRHRDILAVFRRAEGVYGQTQMYLEKVVEVLKHTSASASHSGS